MSNGSDLNFPNQINEDYLEENKKYVSLKKPTIAQGSLLFSIVIVIFLYAGVWTSGFGFNIRGILVEYGVILLPPLLFLLFSKLEIKKVLRLNKVKISNIFIVIGIMMFSIPIVGAINGIFMIIIKAIFGKISLASIEPPQTLVELGIALFVIAISAGICEEVLFRGIILRAYESLGGKKAIIISSILFSLMHFEFQKFVGILILGGIIGYIVYRTNSLYAGMVAHFTNNAIVVFMTFGLTKYMNLIGQDPELAKQNQDFDFSKFTNLSILEKPEELIGLIIVALFFLCFFVFTLTIVIVLFKFFINNTKDGFEKIESNENKESKKGFWWLVPGLSFVALIYIYTGYELLERESYIINFILEKVLFLK